MTLVQTEPKKIYYGESIIISDMQGPSPNGFHVPLTIEWQGLKTIMDGLSLTTSDSWRINLHMPFVGYRDTEADLANQGSEGNYWSSSPDNSDPDYPEFARCLYLDSSDVYADSSDQRSAGLPIRCFKNSYVAPTSSWTVIQGTLGSAGIFWNQSQGLISITDGSTGYTIMDKNLGATTVYNDGDTLTQANMGNMYQWGNNYGFPSTGTISNISYTQVDAAVYGPTNPYSSDTFITLNEDWSSVQNDNLWGGVSQGTTEKGAVKAVYLGENKVRPSAMPAGISYDFQNDGNLGWTLGSSSGAGGATFSYVPGEGFVAQTVAVYAAGTTITPPSSVFDGKTLKKIVMYVYHGNSTYSFSGINNENFRYKVDEGNTGIGFFGANTVYPIGALNGEITITMNFSSTGVTGTVNDISYTVTDSRAANIISAWGNGTFNLTFGGWLEACTTKIRKIVIFTE